MTNRLSPLKDAFPRRSRPLLVIGLVAGDPFLDATRGYMDVVVQAGADVVEVIVPFSDPAFHGPVLRRACDRAMSEKVTWEGIEEMIADFRKGDRTTPLVVSTYFNRVVARGPRRCAEGLADAGADAIHVTDLPAEEAGNFRQTLQSVDLYLAESLAPSTAGDRARRLLKNAEGLVFWTGHCGADVAVDIRWFREHLRELRQYSTFPVVASMNVEHGEDAVEVAQAAHGVLVQSAIAWLIEGRGASVEDRLEDFVSDLRVHLDALAG